MEMLEHTPQAETYLISGLKIPHMILMKLVGWTRYKAFKFFLYLRSNSR